MIKIKNMNGTKSDNKSKLHPKGYRDYSKPMPPPVLTFSTKTHREFIERAISPKRYNAEEEARKAKEEFRKQGFDIK